MGSRAGNITVNVTGTTTVDTIHILLSTVVTKFGTVNIGTQSSIFGIVRFSSDSPTWPRLYQARYITENSGQNKNYFQHFFLTVMKQHWPYSLTFEFFPKKWFDAAAFMVMSENVDQIPARTWPRCVIGVRRALIAINFDLNPDFANVCIFACQTVKFSSSKSNFWLQRTSQDCRKINLHQN